MAKFDMPDDDFRDMPNECEVYLCGTLKGTESEKYEISISIAVNVS